jgi:hypothetical protein
MPNVKSFREITLIQMDFYLTIPEFWLLFGRMTVFLIEAGHEALLGLLAFRQSKIEPCEMNKRLRGTALSVSL